MPGILADKPPISTAWRGICPSTVFQVTLNWWFGFVIWGFELVLGKWEATPSKPSSTGS